MLHVPSARFVTPVFFSTVLSCSVCCGYCSVVRVFAEHVSCVDAGDVVIKGKLKNDASFMPRSWSLAYVYIFLLVSLVENLYHVVHMKFSQTRPLLSAAYNNPWCVSESGGDVVVGKKKKNVGSFHGCLPSFNCFKLCPCMLRISWHVVRGHQIRVFKLYPFMLRISWHVVHVNIKFWSLNRNRFILYPLPHTEFVLSPLTAVFIRLIFGHDSSTERATMQPPS